MDGEWDSWSVNFPPLTLLARQVPMFLYIIQIHCPLCRFAGKFEVTEMNGHDFPWLSSTSKLAPSLGHCILTVSVLSGRLWATKCSTCCSVFNWLFWEMKWKKTHKLPSYTLGAQSLLWPEKTPSLNGFYLSWLDCNATRLLCHLKYLW